MSQDTYFSMDEQIDHILECDNIELIEHILDGADVEIIETSKNPQQQQQVDDPTEERKQENRAYKTVDNALLQKYDVKLYGSDRDTYDIINDFLEDNQSERAFYIVDLGAIVHSYNEWTRLLPDVKPYYAMKCNPNPVILEVLAYLGVNFDCASENEMRTIIEITKDPSRIVFANPCKMSSQIRYARSNDVDFTVADNENELYKIKLYHPYAKIVLRIAVDDSKSKCRFNKKFGCKLYEVEELLTISKTLKLDVIGFSFHVGSACSSADSFYDALKTCRIAADMATKLGITVSLIDIGGGFPGSDNIDVKFETIAHAVNRGIRDFFTEEMEKGAIEFIAEPGRYFAQGSHTLVLNVIGKKKILDETTGEKINMYYLNESVYGSFNCIQNDHYEPVILPFNERDGKLERSRIFGITCDSIDVITENIMLPDLAIGECVYVEKIGAYTIAAASAFNGFAPTNSYKYIFKSIQ